MINKHTKEIIIKTFCDSRTTIQAIIINIKLKIGATAMI